MLYSNQNLTLISFSDGQVTVIGMITIVLAVIIIVTAISVSVFCYIHMKKHRTAGPGGNQAYNNTAYADEKKQIPFTYDNMYVAEKDSNINTAKMTKEQEAMGNQNV